MNPYLIIAAILAIVGAFAGGEFDGRQRAHTADVAATEALKVQAASDLAAETAKTRTAEQALQAITNTQNLKDASHEKTVADLSARLQRAAGPAGRLRDPNATAGGCGAGGGGAQGATTSAAGDRTADGAETGGLLSEQLTGLLQRTQREADAINDAYASCRATAIADRAQH